MAVWIRQQLLLPLGVLLASASPHPAPMLSSTPTVCRLPVSQLPGSMLDSQKNEQGLGWGRAGAGYVPRCKGRVHRVCGFPGVVVTKHPGAGQLRNKRLFSPSAGGWKSELKGLAGWLLPPASLQWFAGIFNVPRLVDTSPPISDSMFACILPACMSIQFPLYISSSTKEKIILTLV